MAGGAVLGFLSLPACGGGSDLEGKLFMAPVQSPAGVVVGLAVDFVPTSGELDEHTVKLVLVSRTRFLAEPSTTPLCITLPKSGRAQLLAASGELTESERVSITAHRDGCDGVALDMAVWPTTSATPPVDAGAEDAAPDVSASETSTTNAQAGGDDASDAGRDDTADAGG